MLPHRHNTLTLLLIVLLFVSVLGYAYLEGRHLIAGPTITLSSGASGAFVSSEQLVAIVGTAERIAELTLDGRPVPVTPEGVFSEEVLLAPGYNRVVLVAKDKAVRAVTETLEIVYTPASSTPHETPIE